MEERSIGLQVGDYVEIVGDCRFPIGTIGQITFVYKTDGSYLVKKVDSILEWNCKPETLRKIDGYWKEMK